MSKMAGSLHTAGVQPASVHDQLPFSAIRSVSAFAADDLRH